MIYINFNIANPWSTFFKPGKVFAGKLFKNKFWEIQLMRTSDVVCFRFELTTRQDHAGVQLEIGFLSFNVNFVVYDNRHWDHLGERWENY